MSGLVFIILAIVAIGALVGGQAGAVMALKFVGWFFIIVLMVILYFVFFEVVMT